MFYSQFILAKKGPLGTIWIAAHLERKLRKNQVAETDIGVSVDSILSPDVPIALRLSSHLLLGVVRIYNKQVNYLFDDCSEALLKVKQAFRSTAVDLPPEQSKAPYHSITLPETFDLDDFELPDNEIYQGNYVDHHVSSREQITLQDTMEGVAFSTTPFGLDERFGDADTSGLDLDEELLLGKIEAHPGASTDPQASNQTMEAPKEDHHQHEEMHTNLVPMIDEVGEHVNLMDDAQAPRTPGLVEEPNFSNVQETSACDDHFESNNRQLTEFAVKENLETSFGETNTHREDCSLPNDTNSDAVVQMPSENGYHSGDMDMDHREVAVEQMMAPDHAPASDPTSLLSNNVTEAFPLPDLADKVVEASDIPCQETNVDYEKINEPLEDHGGLDGSSPKNSHNLESAVILENSRSPSNALDVDVDFQGQEPKESKILSFDVNEENTGAEFPVLRPCNASSDQPALSNDKGDQSVDPNVFNENATQGSVRPSERADNMIDRASDSRMENVKDSSGPDLPAPEKLLSVTEAADDLPRNLIMESTPGGLTRNDDGDAGSSIVSGKKRSYAESTLTEQSLNSVESSRIVRSKRTVESIPDDDDLLSSILVGRKSSVLKVKSTPPPWEMASVKRSYTPRASASKRKVLMDDNMVLHGDTIRQQLMNTEDIRRVRKKAPCTHSEILKIRTQFLEDEIFMEPVSTSGSIELTSLHHQAYDLSGLQVSVDDVNCASPETAAGMKLDTKDGGDSCRDLITDDAPDASVVNFIKDSERERTSDLPVIAENEEGERVEAPSVDESKLDEVPSVSLDVNMNTSQIELPEEVIETGVDGRNDLIAEVLTDLPGAGEPSFPADQVSGDRGDISADVDQVANIDDNSGVMAHTADKIDATDISLNQEAVEVSLEIGATGEEMVEGNDTGGKDFDLAAAVEDERDPLLSEAPQGDATDEPAPTYDDFQSLDVKELEQSMMDYSIAGVGDRLVEDFLMDNEERPSEEIVNPMNPTYDAETSVAYDHDAMNYSAVEYETEFLNVDDDDDDDEEAEPTDDNIPREEVRLVENSGWSSRTRAVANYLQTLFVKQDRNAKPALSMDNLLVGKTRKEASRMFFEALVLKTRDYVHVEQENPFQSIAIKPRSKLMKSDF